MIFILPNICFRYNIFKSYNIEYIIQFFWECIVQFESFLIYLKSANFKKKKKSFHERCVRNYYESKTLTILNANLDPLHTVWIKISMELINLLTKVQTYLQSGTFLWNDSNKNYIKIKPQGRTLEWGFCLHSSIWFFEVFVSWSQTQSFLFKFF